MLDQEKKISVGEFNKSWDQNYVELLKKFDGIEDKLRLQQQSDLNDRIVEFDKKYPPMVKPNSELLNLNKMLSGLVRQKE